MPSPRPLDAPAEEQGSLSAGIESGRGRGYGSLRVWLRRLLGLAVLLASLLLLAGACWPSQGLGARVVDLRHLLGLCLLLGAGAAGLLRAGRLAFVAALLGGWACAPGWWLGLAPAPALPASLARGASDSEVLRIGSANLLFGIGHPRPLSAWIEAEDLEVVCLQEVLDSDRSKLNWPKLLESWRDRFPHQHLLAHPHFGMALISKLPFRVLGSDLLETPGDSEHLRPQRLDVELDWAGGVRLVVVHPPRPGEPWRMRAREDYFRDLGQDLGKVSGPVIVMGDCNATGSSPLLAELRRSARLEDTRLGFGRQPTWSPDVLPRNFPLRMLSLDHLLVRGLIAIERAVGPPIRSDHMPIHGALVRRP